MKRVARKMPPRPRQIAPSAARMADILRKCGIQLENSQLEQLWKFHNLLRARNEDRDLTRITGFEPMVLKHYVDCLIVGKFVKLPSPIVDIGTGAGFPGIPLKIRYPKVRFILAEHRPRRVAFLREVIRELRLKDIEVFEHKVVSRSFQTPVKGVITRALETLDKTLLRTSACLEKGGQLIFLKGPNADAEMRDAEKRLPGQYKRIRDQRYNLPNTQHERRLIVYEKLVDRCLPEGAEDGE